VCSPSTARSSRPRRSSARSLFSFRWDETFDIGSDTGTPVDDADYQVPFPFTGKIDKLTFSLAPPVLTEEDQRKLKEAERARQDAN
jgi:arylsulfatase